MSLKTSRLCSLQKMLLCSAIIFAPTMLAQSVLPGQKPQSTQRPVPASQSRTSPSSLCDVQCAVSELRQNLSINCADATYLEPVISDGHNFRSQIEAVKGLAIVPLAWTITEADRLNKIDWIGEFVLTASAYSAVPQTGDQTTNGKLRWLATHPRRHQIAEEVRTPQADIEGRCSKCVSIANEFESIGAYREAGTWHFFVSDTYTDDLYHDIATGTYTVAPSPGPPIDLRATSAAKPACASFPGSAEAAQLQKRAAEKAAEEKAQAEAEAARNIAETSVSEIKQHTKAMSVQFKIYEHREQNDLPQSELERKTRAAGFWSDQRSGLTWTAKDSELQLTHQQARAYCRSLNVGGFKDWRPPSVDELRGIADNSYSHQFIYGTGAKPDAYHVAGGIILSWPEVANSAADDPKGMHRFDFRNGKVDNLAAAWSATLCVRGGHPDEDSPADERLSILEASVKAALMSLKEIEAEAEVEGRKAADAADQRNQEIRAAAGRARSPQTDLEKKTQADGLWTDPRTGLIWAATSWAGSAREVCKDVKGGPGWRIADLPELTAIFDPTNSHEYFPGRLPTREYHIAGGIMLREPVVWTSFVGAPATESSGKRIDLPNPPIAGYQSQFWTFDFESGQPVRQPGTFAVGKQVLCVRDTTATR